MSSVIIVFSLEPFPQQAHNVHLASEIVKLIDSSYKKNPRMRIRS